MVISVPHTCLFFFFFFHSSFLPSSALRRTGGRDWFHGIPDKVIKDHAPVCTRRTGFSDQLLRFFFVREREKERNFFDDLVAQEFVRVMTIRVIKVLERCLNGM